MKSNVNTLDNGMEIIVENQTGRQADRVPVTAGVPFPVSVLAQPDGLSLKDAMDNIIPVQAQCISRWPDGSCRWVLLDFQADVEGLSASYMLSAEKKHVTPEHPVAAAVNQDGIMLSNGMIVLDVKIGRSSVDLRSADGDASIGVFSDVQLGHAGSRITSTVTIDTFELCAAGPVRAAVTLKGRRMYSDGIEGPFSQSIEMFAGSATIKVEDTFIYAHDPGTHAEPRNPLSLWKIGTHISRGAEMLTMLPYMDAAESDGLVVSDGTVAFWGLEEPFDLSRHTDEDLIGEDCPGIALGLAKTCAALIGIAHGGNGEAANRPVYGVWAHTTPEVYAYSGAFGQFAPQMPGMYEEIEQGIRQILGFWIWFQDHDSKGIFGRGPWHGLFDWGDWQTRYSDIHGKPVGWQYHEGRYGWDCGEMDTTQMLWSAFLHTGSPEFWRPSVAMSRHAMDVDMINVDYRKYDLPWYIYDYHHYDAPWQEGRDRLFEMDTTGLGRRHNVQHWGNGVGDTRHTFNAGIITYYFLTGNRRAYDAAVAMADMHMQRIMGYAAGEYALAMECIYGAWQITGDSKYIEEFRYRLAVIQQLQLPGGSLPNHLDFNEQKAYLEVDGDSGSDSGLVLDYISNALCNYYLDTGDAMAKDILMGLTGSIMNRSLRVGEMYPDVSDIRILAWAFNETGDGGYLERVEYLINTMGCKPLDRWPAIPEEWVESTYEVMGRQQWRIRHIGPGVRMIPYGLFSMLHKSEVLV